MGVYYSVGYVLKPTYGHLLYVYYYYAELLVYYYVPSIILIYGCRLFLNCLFFCVNMH